MSCWTRCQPKFYRSDVRSSPLHRCISKRKRETISLSLLLFSLTAVVSRSLARLPQRSKHFDLKWKTQLLLTWQSTGNTHWHCHLTISSITTVNMPSLYHSTLESRQKIGNISKLTFRTKFNGPIRTVEDEHLRKEDPVGADIIDEALYFFKSNIFFSSYEIKSEADRNIIYLTLYIIECLKVIGNASSRNAATQELFQLGLSKFAIPGDSAFPLNNLYSKPASSKEADEMRSYLTQLRQECGLRVLEQAWPTGYKTPSKWWCCFAKRKFLNISLAER